MFIFWGKKRTEISQGFVAEFCPICRTICPFRIIRIGLAKHIYYIALGEGEMLMHMKHCHKCGLIKSVEDLSNYKAFEKQADTNIETLILTTFPTIRTVYAERLDIESKIKNHQPFPLSYREKLLMEPFEHLASKIEGNITNTNFDKETKVGCLATIILTVLIGGGAFTLMKLGLRNQWLFDITEIVAGVGFLYTLIQLLLVKNRSVNRIILPQLIKTLWPLNPSQEELAKCLAKFKEEGFQIGKKIKPDILWASLEKYSQNKN